MQLFCVAALLLSAVSAQPDFWAQDEVFAPADGTELEDGPQLGDDEQLVTGAPGEDQWAGEDEPDWAELRKPGFQTDGARAPLRGFTRRFGPVECVPAFRVGNATLQNDSDATLPQGESIFVEQPCRRGLRHPKGGRNRPYLNCLKFTFNTTGQNEVSIEYGVVKPKLHKVLL